LSANKNDFSKILILVDGSQPSINAADSAIAFAKKKDRDSSSPQQLIALHMVFLRLEFAYSPSGAFGSTGLTIHTWLVSSIDYAVNELLDSTKKEAELWFDKIRQKINRDIRNSNIQLQTEVVVTATSIVSAIVEYAKDKKVDLIVTGTRGRSEFKNYCLAALLQEL
jgi:nucleotide-binding universal stress UspA family protein